MRHQVVGGERRRRRVGAGEQPHRRLVAAVLLEVGDLDDDLDTGRFALGDEAGVALGAGGGVERTGDEGDAPMPVLDQQPGGGGGSSGVVDQHGIGVAGVRQRAVDEDDRDTEGGERLRRLGVVAGRCQRASPSTRSRIVDSTPCSRSELSSVLHSTSW